MPLQQKTFTVVPPPGMPSKGPRPPMTSKQAKKLYKQAIPKVSRLEQRQIEAEEHQRIRREQDKERAAGRAKAAKERKQKKANEAREIRKMDPPKPRPGERASRDKMMEFIKLGAGVKRARDEVGDDGEGHIEEGNGEGLHLLDHDDNYGSEVIEALRRSSSPPAASQMSFNNANIQLGQAVFSGAGPLKAVNGVLDTTTAEDRQTTVTPRASSPSHQTKHPDIEAEMSPTSIKSGKSFDVKSRSATPTCNADRCGEKIDHTGFRTSPREVRNRTPQSVCATSKRMASPPSKVPRRRSSAASAPSTLAFLEDNFDDFFPSSSQQARELMGAIDDIPSNTQVAREISTEGSHCAALLSSQPAISLQPAEPLGLARSPTLLRATCTQQSPELRPAMSTAQTDLGLEFLSSQDFVLSSQDLRDINTPCRPAPSHLIQNGLHRGTNVKKEQSAPRPRPKPKFFEEKEEDLIHAAIEASLRTVEPRF